MQKRRTKRTVLCNKDKPQPIYMIAGGDVRVVTIRNNDGKVYKDPKKIHISRNEKTEMFYRIVDQYVPKQFSEDKSRQPHK
jgi:hypothetical protein